MKHPAIALAFFMSVATPSSAALLYYNDGCQDNFHETFGDVMYCVPFNAAFEPGGFMDGTSDDIPPYNQNTNAGLVTKQGAAGGVQGGGFRLVQPVGGGAGGKQMGAVAVTYGTLAQKKTGAGAQWIANVKNLGRALGVDPRSALDIWVNDGVLIDGVNTKLVKYIGDPLVSPPPMDLAAADLDPIDTVVVTEYLMDENVQIFFWEVEGERPMDALDFLFGDYALNTGYVDVMHHFPWMAVLEDVGPADFGIAVGDANMITFNGDGLVGPGGFVGTMAVEMYDPPATIPVPPAALLAGSALAALSLLRIGRRKPFGKS